MNTPVRFCQKQFLKSVGLIVSSALVISLVSSCSSSIPTMESKRLTRNTPSRIQDWILYMPSSQPIPVGRMGDEDLFHVPMSALHIKGVCKVIQRDDGVWLQEVQVRVVDQDESDALVSGLNKGDRVLLNNPKALIELNKLDHKGLTYRFLRAAPPEPEGDGKPMFQQAIRDLATYTVTNTFGNDIGKDVFRIPENAISKHAEDPFVLCVRENEKGLWLQNVHVTVIDEHNGFALIRGVDINDKLILSPRASLMQLSRIDHQELSKRGLRPIPPLEYR